MTRFQHSSMLVHVLNELFLLPLLMIGHDELIFLLDLHRSKCDVVQSVRQVGIRRWTDEFQVLVMVMFAMRHWIGEKPSSISFIHQIIPDRNDFGIYMLVHRQIF